MGRQAYRAAIGLAALLGSVSAVASQGVPKRAGMLCSVHCAGPGYVAFDDELRKLGWIEGQNLVIDRRAAEGRYERLPKLAAELLRLTPDLVIAAGPDSAKAASDATTDVPVIFSFVADPVRMGIIKSLARPGGNVTGVTALVPGGFIGKQLDLIRELLPSARRVAALINPASENTRLMFSVEAPLAAARLGFELDTIEVHTFQDILGAVERAKVDGADALFVMADPMLQTPPDRIPDIAARVAIPAIYTPREMVQAGGLMSYTPEFLGVARRHAHYVDRVLRGTPPSELPVEQPTKYDLVINLKTAAALGLDIPQSLLARADEVIE